jgi:hypothetical protein
MIPIRTPSGAPLDAAHAPTAPFFSGADGLAALVERAEDALATSALRVAGVFPRKSSTLPVVGYTVATVDFGGETWSACSGKQDNNAARLLDAAVAHRMAVGAKHGVAILRPPPGTPKYDAGTLEFLRAYQAAVWHGCGILFLRETAIGASPSWQDPPPPADHRRFLEGLENDIRGALAAPDIIPSDFLHSSSDAECIVRPIVHRLLYRRGYNRMEAHYASFWRRAATDGSWRIDGGDAPRRIALEVKLAEDVDWPLCQPVEALAAHDAVLVVRIVTPGVGKSLAGLAPAAKEAVARMTRTLPVRSIEFNSAV